MGLKETVFRITHAQEIKQAEANHNAKLSRLGLAIKRFERPGVVGRLTRWSEIKKERDDAGYDYNEAKMRRIQLRERAGTFLDETDKHTYINRT